VATGLACSPMTYGHKLNGVKSVCIYETEAGLMTGVTRTRRKLFGRDHGVLRMLCSFKSCVGISSLEIRQICFFD